MKNIISKLPSIKISLIILSLLVTGCNSFNMKQNTVLDPFETINRKTHKFNNIVDKIILLPIAKSYNYVVPNPIKSCVHNVFANVEDLKSACNSFLQGQGINGINTIGRFLFNTTMGVGGCFDVASINGAYKIPNDFGITLGKWGVPSGPYLVIPFAGPSNFRDALAAMSLKYLPEPTGHIKNNLLYINNFTNTLYIVDYRASILNITDVINEVAIDPYILIRDCYTKQREEIICNYQNDEPYPEEDYNE
ncbi:lipoprotein [Candidatus Kinetoplastibacterium desouzaii TCC079E]|uniref:Lipoprotein n=1 Tax=Candidatus Kinetoplastidibacterium desouzai TCC079E TaxID=1208919 RepID=M1LR02_9PROT|nr:VacJ family lipoprotein [Candidatus Kinetoplastibacterium desouzaii]AGF46591.1 lipoprotein [Candidatus Kinetoplastibacterium desouzaii TCC079E]